MLHTKLKIFHINFLSFKNGIKILICSFKMFFIKLKNYIPVPANAKKIFETIKINFMLFETVFKNCVL